MQRIRDRGEEKAKLKGDQHGEKQKKIEGSMRNKERVQGTTTEYSPVKSERRRGMDGLQAKTQEKGRAETEEDRPTDLAPGYAGRE